MEVKSINDGLLTNIEVFDLLLEKRNIKSDNDKANIEKQCKEFIEIKTIEYFRSSKIGNMYIIVVIMYESIFINYYCFYNIPVVVVIIWYCYYYYNN